MGKTSPFLTPGSASSPASLAILHLRRDQQIPTTLQSKPDAEDEVTNTRFGSYPHSTLVNVPWGSQILASNVNTGRGRGKKARKAAESASKKRKLDEIDDTQASGADSMDIDQDTPKQTEKEEAPLQAASTGFCHILPPTPESWTVSLPHRTQVVYTPDYSFILQKMRARPGCVLIEAGAGSGSFTHAAARAVFNGYPSAADEKSSTTASKKRKRHGHVYSYEYHAPRAQQLQDEISEHGLDEIVTVTHRDVYADGFLLPPTPSPSTSAQTTDPISPLATNIFLDLPDPSLALPHLTRSSSASPLDPKRTAHITCFVPCIEQVTKAVDSLRRHGWVSIQMFELAHKRLDVRRDHVGLDLEGLRGVNATAASVEEALARLREVEERQLDYRGLTGGGGDDDDDDEEDDDQQPAHKKRPQGRAYGHPENRESKQDRLARLAQQAKSRKMYNEGRLTHRTEPELKTHTSYLIFAILPRAWGAEEEARLRARHPASFGGKDATTTTAAAAAAEVEATGA